MSVYIEVDFVDNNIDFCVHTYSSDLWNDRENMSKKVEEICNRVWGTMIAVVQEK